MLFIENITRWREHMNFIFEWKKYFIRSSRSLVKSFFHEKINFRCSSQRVIFFLLKKTRRKTKEKQKNCVSDIFTSEDMENMLLVSRM